MPKGFHSKPFEDEKPIQYTFEKYTPTNFLAELDNSKKKIVLAVL